MRITTKILAAAVIALSSVSSFAADVVWTGTLASSKIQYYPSTSADPTYAAVIVNGVTGSPCSWPALGTAKGVVSMTDATADDAHALFAFLSQAKKDGTSITLRYDPALTLCQITSYIR